MPELRTYQFPPTFLWGAATSSHQVEGDNRWNDWWEHEQQGHLPYASGAACRHYERFAQDFDLAKSWGHNAHRFSIEWSRIEPSQGTWNHEALFHYREVIQALRERGLEPVVTLHHFTNPAWFTQRGGWLRNDSARLFAEYADYIVRNLGADVRYWLTVNEPTVYVMQGYINGEWPPFFKSAWIKAGIALSNLARAHVYAYQALHGANSQNMVGFAHNAPFVVPCNPGSKRDRVAARLRDWVCNRSFFRLIGSHARSFLQNRKSLDFIGVNYYTRTAILSAGYGIKALLGQTCRFQHHHEQGPITAMGWEVFPRGLEAVLRKFSAYGLPLFITENGIATDDESLRRNFVLKHLEAMACALDGGVNVIGYLYWSLIDNFEWALGTAPRFGLAEVNYENQKRSSRAYVEDFSRVCRENRLIFNERTT